MLGTADAVVAAGNIIILFDKTYGIVLFIIFFFFTNNASFASATIYRQYSELNGPIVINTARGID